MKKLKLFLFALVALSLTMPFIANTAAAEDVHVEDHMDDAHDAVETMDDCDTHPHDDDHHAMADESDDDCHDHDAEDHADEDHHDDDHHDGHNE